ncbi:MAG: hypothetical protein F6K16_31355, partial [Symploca sp. SIO2B6]|nr:hypothetical protein [Symploca sp. SIO2B6]
MTSGNINEDELRRREAELQRREQEIRLRELEAELHEIDPPLSKTVKHQEPRKKKNWLRKIPKFAKFGIMVFSVFVVTLVAMRIAVTLV